MEKTTMNVQKLASQMGIILPQSIQAGKTAGFPCDPCREQNPHPRRGIRHTRNGCVRVQ